MNSAEKNVPNVKKYLSVIQSIHEAMENNIKYENY